MRHEAQGKAGLSFSCDGRSLSIFLLMIFYG